MAGELKIIPCSCTLGLARRIAEYCGVEPVKVSVTRFSDGEMQPVLKESIYLSDVYIIQSTHPPSENFHELLLLTDAAKRASASSVVAVIPYFGYTRRDNLLQESTGLAAKLHIRLLAVAGVDRVICLDMYPFLPERSSEIPFDHLNSTGLFASLINKLGLDCIAFGATDNEEAALAEHYAKLFNTNYIVCNKHKPKSDDADTSQIVGNPEGQNIILTCNVVATAGSICAAAEIVMDKGAKSVRAIATHALLSGDAYERIERSVLRELFVTDTIQLKQVSEKIKVISTAEIFADAIMCLKANNPVTPN